LVALEADFGK